MKGPLRAGKRDDIERLSGQRKYPVIEFEDGSAYREESKDMAARIGAGRLFGDSPEPEIAPWAVPAGRERTIPIVLEGYESRRWD